MGSPRHPCFEFDAEDAGAYCSLKKREKGKKKKTGPAGWHWLALASIDWHWLRLGRQRLNESLNYAYCGGGSYWLPWQVLAQSGTSDEHFPQTARLRPWREDKALLCCAVLCSLAWPGENLLCNARVPPLESGAELPFVWAGFSVSDIWILR